MSSAERRFKMCLTAEQIRFVLSGAFGHLHPMHWPFPGQQEPKRGVLTAAAGEKMERQINAALSIIGAPRINQTFRDAYWNEARVGQYAEEDAGGAIWRFWLAALGFGFPRGTTYAEAVSALADGPSQADGVKGTT